MRKRWIALGLLTATCASAYFLWTRGGAIVAIRWFLRETGIPLEIRSARWELRIGELLKGKIRELQLDAYYRPLDARFEIETPVSFARQGTRWSVDLNPKVRVGKLPPAQGSMKLTLDPLQRTGRAAAVEFRLRHVEPFRMREGKVSLSAQRWSAEGDLAWDPDEADPKLRWTSRVNARAEEVRLEPPGAEPVSVEWVEVHAGSHWPSTPPLPLEGEAEIVSGPVQWALGDAWIQEDGGKARVSFQFDGRNFDPFRLEMREPVELRVAGTYKEGALRADWMLNAALENVVEPRIAQWAAVAIPILRRAKGAGTVRVSARTETEATGGLRLRGRLAVDARAITLPSRDVRIQGVRIEAPLRYPEMPEWGEITVSAVEVQSIRMKNLAVRTRLSQAGIDVTTRGPDGLDRPIEQAVWGGVVAVSKLEASKPLVGPPKFSLSVKGGPFRLADMQKDLCFLPKHPLGGELKFDYPEVVQDLESVHLLGESSVTAFNGSTRLGDLHLSLSKQRPRLRFSLEWKDLDLRSIGEWTRLGDMRGSLDGHLADAVFAVTPLGPVPMSYDFEVRGRERSGKTISFYGRAVDSILELMGSRRGDMPWYASTAIGLSTLWRNLLPAKADYMGFRAKTTGEWTELSTFDPPGLKKHYLLYGNDFKIPLNSHGVYPAILKTDAFQGWLWGMVEYAKGRLKNDEGSDGDAGDKNECTPLF